MILLLDNFDSFTYNLVDYFHRLGVDTKLFRNDVSLEEIRKHTYQAVVLSPGPQRPAVAGSLVQVLEAYCRQLPVLGICLGHQAIGEYFGAQLVEASQPMHGKLSRIACREHPLFEGIGSSMQVVRYHSLVLKELPDCLRVLASTDKGEVMAVEHKGLPVTGLQFHPEAALTENGLQLLGNWVKNHHLGK